LLAELTPLGAKLDEGTGIRRGDAARPMADGEAWRYRHDPPLQARTATLVGSVLHELRALRIAPDAVVFPTHWNWAAASRPDLRRALVDMLSSGWRNRQLTHAERSSFAELLNAWSALARTDLQRHEQQTMETAA
jgi:hypothetical protein